MPVTFCPAPHHQIESFRRPWLATSRSLLLATYKDCEEPPTSLTHVQGSFGRHGFTPVSIAARRNGFVDTVVDAYNHHHALAIRPDDVWTCILTQFSLFVNGEGRAERLRHLFVAHEGQKSLTVFEDSPMDTADHASFARRMTELLHENVVDPELRAWILPDFSTTTPNDTIVGSVIMMATLKAYFVYHSTTRCGLPRVTLLGTQDDWLRIFARVDKLGQYGPETSAWRDLLRPVLARFARAFEPGYAESAENLDFWQRVAHVQGGSGTDRLCGWITAFCAFGNEGQWMGAASALQQYSGQTPETSSGSYVFGTIDAFGPRSGLIIDGVSFHAVGTNVVPAAVVEVNIDNNGVDCVMRAGVVGTTSADVRVADKVVRDGEIRPATAWWIYRDSPPRAWMRRGACGLRLCM